MTPSNCDIKGRLSFNRLCRLAIDSRVFDGEAFIRVHWAGEYGMQLEVVDAKMIDHGFNQDRKDGSYIRFGIEYNNSDRAIAYHINKDAGGRSDFWSNYMQTMERERVPAEEMYHLFEEEWVGQRRGLPMLATSLQTLKIADDYEGSALNAAKMGAKSSLFAQAKEGHESLLYDDENNPIDIDLEVSEQDITVLPAGFEIQSARDPYPAGEFDQFMRRTLKRIFSGVGVDYSLGTNDLDGVNYSSLRHAARSEKDTYMSMQNWFKELFLMPLFKDWIERQYVLQNILIAGKPLSRDVNFYKAHDWQGRRWQSPDPTKDITAAEKLVEMKAASVSSVIRENSQRSPLEVFNEIAEEKKAMEQLGITASEVISSVKSEPQKEGASQNNDETENE